VGEATTGETRNVNSGRSIRRFVPVTLAMPVLGSALGIDGGAIFQIFASDDLGLGPTAIGVAFGLGVVSVPVQIWAARMPLWRARRNLRTFLVAAAVQTWVLAVLVARGSGSGVAGLALAVTVVAEVSLSVLYATAWQPLMSYTLSSVERQQLNTRIRAGGGGLAAISVLVFATLGQTARVGFLFMIGFVALWLAVSLRSIAAPSRRALNSIPTKSSPEKQRVPTSMRVIYLVLAFVGLASWPLLLLYVHLVLWPTANLGVVGALQVSGSLAASLAWLPTDADVTARARAGGVALVAAGAGLAALRLPIETHAEMLAVLALVVIAAAATTTIRIAMLELAHRSIDESSSVRAFTLLDVVGSTSVQLGLFVGGLLVAWSANAPIWVVDPYRIYMVAGALAALAAIVKLSRR